MSMDSEIDMAALVQGVLDERAAQLEAAEAERIERAQAEVEWRNVPREEWERRYAPFQAAAKIFAARILAGSQILNRPTNGSVQNPEINYRLYGPEVSLGFNVPAAAKFRVAGIEYDYYPPVQRGYGFDDVEYPPVKHYGGFKFDLTFDKSANVVAVVVSRSLASWNGSGESREARVNPVLEVNFDPERPEDGYKAIATCLVNHPIYQFG